MPKIFISYSWSSPKHEEWVRELAERLIANGVDVVFDKWDLKEGHDAFNFMESMVKDVDVEKVLIILDQKYTEKADGRAGGVGTETLIISPNVYDNVAQEKFIPIVAECAENGNPFIPVYLTGRIYIDLSKEEHFEENYEKLLRNIFNRPTHSRPKLGKAPDYLFEDTPMTHKTTYELRTLESRLHQNTLKPNPWLNNFLEVFYDDLKNYSLVGLNGKTYNEIGKEIHDNILSYTPLRNDYIKCLDKLLQNEVEFDISILIQFFEKLQLLKKPQDGRGSWNTYEFDNFRFFIHELFLYTVAIGLRNRNYNFLEEILYATYFFSKGRDNPDMPERYVHFFNHITTFNEYYNDTFTKRLISPMADLIMKGVPDNMSKDDILDADILCHYIAALDSIKWFPITYIYREYPSKGVEIFSRLISKSHFEKVKILFKVNTPHELQIKLKEFQNSNSMSDGYPNAMNSIPRIGKLIEIDKIATMR